MTGVALGSDAFFPFGDNIERAHKSGVSYIAQPGGSVRDDHVIGTCDKYNMAMAFTGIRLFHPQKYRQFLFHTSPFIMRRRQIFHYKWGFPISLRPSIFAALHLKTNQR